ncbi:STAS domain-containing protein [Marinomonas mediterranea]|jgi:Anti-anti-sigma regulatory factor (antagonist of anti-sigma factor)|uniref:Sulfate transporter/antisigma-factor antagonist STAS n=1 Tax=Marinomonas mediterranea (strain ATCC 700492 / JCM 21426 / NBRC 103028 / MMB-1) TaxID=717774 RepID=F2K3K8_MARM1|nr:STAS domain-containing protein [Marinomonas mediterranea]ADZ92447.1 Sulfate transporter/antisigma-factor antagonist STAS [Marinomonas mediterranea MMB-1]WCN10398.1 STAS domain-containing protein [Marinomonas mediterranea]WCN14444.1 STAS domain-containing protein [Marinomonas mediterranea]WCN18496.1 STAS domain-containing protein [Marinomonas mediterranea MMB-1]
MINCVKRDGVATIEIQGAFDFSCHKGFTEAIEKLKAEEVVRVDLSQTTYLDSSALGMLILLRDHVKVVNGSVVLFSPDETVNNALKMANFDRLFKIER